MFLAVGLSLAEARLSVAVELCSTTAGTIIGWLLGQLRA